MKVHYHISIFILLCSAFSSAFASDFNINKEENDKALLQFSGENSPGFAVVVTHEDKLAYTYYRGLASLEHHIAIDGQTIFNIASISKSFTGYAIAQLVRKGEVDTNTSIRRYIPELSEHYEPIKIKHLLHHTSGLWDWSDFLTVAGFNFSDRAPNFTVLLDVLNKEHAVSFGAGEEEAYSNTNYLLLSEIVSRVSQQSFEEYLENNVFEKMGMQSARIDNRGVLTPNLATSYEQNGKNFYPSTYVYSAPGSSAVLLNIEDFSKWMLSFNNVNDDISKTHAVARMGGQLNAGVTVNYGYGIGLFLGGERPYVAHSGGWSSFRSNYRYYINEKVGVAVFCNFVCNYNLIRKAIEKNIFSESEQVATLEDDEPKAVKIENTYPFEGNYRLQPGWIISIKSTDDGVSAEEFIYGKGSINVFAIKIDELYLPKYKAILKYSNSGHSVTFSDAFGEIEADVLASTKYDPEKADNYTGIYYSKSLDTSYRVLNLEDGLYIAHSSNGKEKLTPINSKIFSGEGQFVAELHFDFNEKGKATGITFYSARLRGLRFDRIVAQ